MIYFIREEGKNGRIKIGHSEDVKRRLQQIQGCNPRKLKILAEVVGNKTTEKNIHNLFKKFKCKNTREWFKDNPSIHNFIQRVVN